MFAAQYEASMLNTKINEVQKHIGAKKKAKEGADDLMKQKAGFEKEKKELLESVAAKKDLLDKKIKTIGNIVHDSVPVNNDEVLFLLSLFSGICLLVSRLIVGVFRTTMLCSAHGARKE